MGDEGAITLARSLEVNGTLRTLNLGYNDISATGARALLRRCHCDRSTGDAPSSITSLDLQFNELGPEV